MVRFKPGDVVVRLYSDQPNYGIMCGGAYTVEDCGEGWVQVVGAETTFNPYYFDLVKPKQKELTGVAKFLKEKGL